MQFFQRAFVVVFLSTADNLTDARETFVGPGVVGCELEEMDDDDDDDDEDDIH